MMRTVTRYVARAGLIFGFASALGLSVAHTSVNAQTPVARPKALANATLEPAPKALTGTLFNTREQRENLDRARVRSGLVEDEVASPADPKPPVINGFVKRSDGRDTVWVDDVMKRDPRSEVMEQLVPDLVGGTKMGLALRNSSEGKATPAVLKKTGAMRVGIASNGIQRNARKKRIDRLRIRAGASDYRNQR
jgi:hypothetical protein